MHRLWSSSILSKGNATKVHFFAPRDFPVLQWIFSVLILCSFPPLYTFRYFEAQLEQLVERTGLPLFLHMRSACDDFVEIVQRHRQKFKYPFSASLSLSLSVTHTKTHNSFVCTSAAFLLFSLIYWLCVCHTYGVVHSFTGSMEELQKLLALDLHIGINGCSLKTKENLEVMCAVPADRLLIETG